jgi:hypothetical protein
VAIIYWLPHAPARAICARGKTGHGEIQRGPLRVKTDHDKLAVGTEITKTGLARAFSRTQRAGVLRCHAIRKIEFVCQKSRKFHGRRSAAGFLEFYFRRNIDHRMGTICSSGAFSSEVDTGLREENASKQKPRAPFRFHRNGKALALSAHTVLRHRRLISSSGASHRTDDEPEQAQNGFSTDRSVMFLHRSADS